VSGALFSMTKTITYYKKIKLSQIIQYFLEYQQLLRTVMIYISFSSGQVV